MNKLIYTLIISFFLSGCSLKDKPIFWKNNEPETKPNIKKSIVQKKIATWKKSIKNLIALNN